MGFRVQCTCGKEAAVEAGSIGRPFTCGACNARSVVVWGIDPKTKKAAPITFEATSASKRGFKIPLGVSELSCTCGLSMFARPRQAGKRVQCPVCSTWLKLEHSKDPQTLETRIRVVKSRLNQLPAMPPQARTESSVQSILCSCGETLRIETTPSGNQAQCTACGTQIRLEMNQDSVSSCIVIDPRTAPEADPAEKRGVDEDLSLEDFN